MAVSTISSPANSTEELARFRLWLADKIEASLPDKVVLERDNPQSIKLIKDRYDLAKQRAKVPIPPDQEQQFFGDLLDEILGFGPLGQAIEY